MITTLDCLFVIDWLLYLAGWSTLGVRRLAYWGAQ